SDVAAPLASVVTYKFAATGGKPAVDLIWYDGGLRPSLPDEYEIDRKVADNGIFFEGDKGVIFSDLWSPRIVPEAKMKEYKLPPKTLPRVKDHYENWLEACKAGGKAVSDFDYAGPLTETVLLGNLAIRAGKKIYWDSENMKVTNCQEANRFVQRQYRQGWSL
ncbi:MAG TPA: hypothetical protein PLP05_05575, partial [Sedimentisphaerales bacterium]|nr:hypothetical protein [Sedimentisphaerales bacterium]